MDHVTDASNHTKRRRGRASRRRRKKVLEIEQAEQRHTTLLEDFASPPILATTNIPIDRNTIWPHCIHFQDKFSNADKTSLISQLGFLPGNAIHITCRLNQIPGLKGTSPNEPVAIQLYPLASRLQSGMTGKARKRKLYNASDTDITAASDAATDNSASHHKQVVVIEPFPTMFWLTHPLLRILISKLEVIGFGITLEKRLQEQTEYLERMGRAHKAYGHERFGLLNATDLRLIQERNWTSAVNDTKGVSGIRKPEAVKCLHAHVAHYLSRPDDENIVGKWVMAEIEQMLQQKNKESQT